MFDTLADAKRVLAELQAGIEQVEQQMMKSGRREKNGCGGRRRMKIILTPVRGSPAQGTCQRIVEESHNNHPAVDDLTDLMCLVSRSRARTGGTASGVVSRSRLWRTSRLTGVRAVRRPWS